MSDEDGGGDSRKVLVEGLAAVAISLAEMGTGPDDARSQLLGWLQCQSLHPPDVTVVRDAAAVVGRFPQPVDEPAEVIERSQHIRQLLGVPSAGEQLAAQLVAREWLQQFAAAMEAADGG